MTRLESAIFAINTALVNANDQQLLIGAKCRGLMAGYDARWSDEEYLIFGVEDTVTADLWNLVTEHKSRSFRIAGKLDIRGVHGSRAVIMDHKTTSEDISDPTSPYWKQLAIEGQATHYMLLEWLNGRKADMAIWDVVKKPGISPKNVSKSDRAQVNAARKYCGRPISSESIEEMTATERETLEMYEARLANDCTNERPDNYFQRRSIPRLDSELAEYAQDLWDHSKEILHARQTNRHQRNSGACMLYGRPCTYLGICSGYDTPDSDKWRKKQNVHSELPEIEGDGKDVLTNSRIRCFQTCRKLHYFRYELGIERNQPEDVESLYFGTLWHLGLEAWFKASMAEDTPYQLVQIEKEQHTWQA